MGAGLGAGSSHHVLLYFLPIFTVKLESFEESAVFKLTPSSLVTVGGRGNYGCGNCILVPVSQTMQDLGGLLVDGDCCLEDRDFDSLGIDFIKVDLD